MHNGKNVTKQGREVMPHTGHDVHVVEFAQLHTRLGAASESASRQGSSRSVNPTSASSVAALSLLCWSSDSVAACRLEKYAEIPVTMQGRVPIVKGSIDGKPVRFIADSGAVFSFLWSDELDGLGLKSAATGLEMSHVDGPVVARVTTVKDFSLEGLGRGSIHNVQFLVVPRDGAGSAGLIGQNILGHADAEFDLANGVIRLFHAQDCHEQMMAYWHGDALVSVLPVPRATDGRDPEIPVGAGKLDGKDISVRFDTGSSTSWLSLAAATRAGFDKTKADEVHAAIADTEGRRGFSAWIWRFRDLDLGGEQVRQPKLRVNQTKELSDFDLVLGVDFFLSHRIYVAASQRKIYFTYNGGPVFDIPGASPVNQPVIDASPKAQQNASAPREELPDAAAYKRRAAASAARGDIVAAIADYDAAARIDPADPESVVERAKLKMRAKRNAEAREDLDLALKLKPDFTLAFYWRGFLRLQENDAPGARADFDAAVSSAPEKTQAGIDLDISQDLTMAGYYDEAIARLDLWMARFPNSEYYATGLNARCWARALAGKELQGALEDCNAALKLKPDNAATLDSRGLVWLRLGEARKSEKDYGAAIQRGAKGAWTLYGLGLAKLRSGNEQEANRRFREASAVDAGIADRFKKIGLSP